LDLVAERDPARLRSGGLHPTTIRVANRSVRKDRARQTGHAGNGDNHVVLRTAVAAVEEASRPTASMTVASSVAVSASSNQDGLVADRERLESHGELYRVVELDLDRLIGVGDFGGIVSGDAHVYVLP